MAKESKADLKKVVKEHLTGVTDASKDTIVPPEIHKSTSNSASHEPKRYLVLYDFDAQEPSELSVQSGDFLVGTPNPSDPQWLLVFNERNDEVGEVPFTFTKQIDALTPRSSFVKAMLEQLTPPQSPHHANKNKDEKLNDVTANLPLATPPVVIEKLNDAPGNLPLASPQVLNENLNDAMGNLPVASPKVLNEKLIETTMNRPPRPPRTSNNQVTAIDDESTHSATAISSATSTTENTTTKSNNDLKMTTNIPNDNSSEWIELLDDDGNKYYFNQVTNESQWVNPVESTNTFETADEWNWNTELGNSHPIYAVADGWLEMRDVSSGEPYYLNLLSGESQWPRPLAGGWTVQIDPNSSFPYYEHTITGNTTWVAPPEVLGTELVKGKDSSENNESKKELDRQVVSPSHRRSQNNREIQLDQIIEYIGSPHSSRTNTPVVSNSRSGTPSIKELDRQVVSPTHHRRQSSREIQFDVIKRYIGSPQSSRSNTPVVSIHRSGTPGSILSETSIDTTTSNEHTSDTGSDDYIQPKSIYSNTVVEEIRRLESSRRLSDLGFPIHECSDALIHCKGDENEAAIYLLNAKQHRVKHELEESLVDMGFEKDLGIVALKNADGDITRAIQWLLDNNTSLSERTTKREKHQKNMMAWQEQRLLVGREEGNEESNAAEETTSNTTIDTHEVKLFEGLVISKAEVSNAIGTTVALASTTSSIKHEEELPLQQVENINYKERHNTLKYLKRGMRVKVNWNENGEYNLEDIYPGFICNVSPDLKTVAVRYDDGDYESSVPIQYIHPIRVNDTPIVEGDDLIAMAMASASSNDYVYQKKMVSPRDQIRQLKLLKQRGIGGLHRFQIQTVSTFKKLLEAGRSGLGLTSFTETDMPPRKREYFQALPDEKQSYYITVASAHWLFEDIEITCAETASKNMVVDIVKQTSREMFEGTKTINSNGNKKLRRRQLRLLVQLRKDIKKLLIPVADLGYDALKSHCNNLNPNNVFLTNTTTTVDSSNRETMKKMAGEVARGVAATAQKAQNWARKLLHKNSLDSKPKHISASDIVIGDADIKASPILVELGDDLDVRRGNSADAIEVARNQLTQEQNITINDKLSFCIKYKTDALRLTAYDKELRLALEKRHKVWDSIRSTLENAKTLWNAQKKILSDWGKLGQIPCLESRNAMLIQHLELLMQGEKLAGSIIASKIHEITAMTASTEAKYGTNSVYATPVGDIDILQAASDGNAVAAAAVAAIASNAKRKCNEGSSEQSLERVSLNSQEAQDSDLCMINVEFYLNENALLCNDTAIMSLAESILQIHNQLRDADQAVYDSRYLLQTLSFDERRAKLSDIVKKAITLQNSSIRSDCQNSNENKRPPVPHGGPKSEGDDIKNLLILNQEIQWKKIQKVFNSLIVDKRNPQGQLLERLLAQLQHLATNIHLQNEDNTAAAKISSLVEVIPMVATFLGDVIAYDFDIETPQILKALYELSEGLIYCCSAIKESATIAATAVASTMGDNGRSGDNRVWLEQQHWMRLLTPEELGVPREFCMSDERWEGNGVEMDTVISFDGNPTNDKICMLRPTSPFPRTSLALTYFSQCRVPMRMLRLLLCIVQIAHDEVNDALSQHKDIQESKSSNSNQENEKYNSKARKLLEADSLLPVLIAAVVHCEAPNLPESLRWAMVYGSQPNGCTGQSSYYLVALQSAVRHVCTVTQTDKQLEMQRTRVQSIAIMQMQQAEIKRMCTWIQINLKSRADTAGEFDKEKINLLKYLEETEDRIRFNGTPAEIFLEENDQTWGLSASWKEALKKLNL